MTHNNVEIDIHGYLGKHEIELIRYLEILLKRTTKIDEPPIIDFPSSGLRVTGKAKIVVIIPAGWDFAQLKQMLERLPLAESVNIIEREE